MNNSWGFINDTGTVVIKPSFLRAYSFKNSLADVEIGTPDGIKNALVDRMVLSLLSGRLMLVKTSLKEWLCLNATIVGALLTTTGQTVIRPKYDAVESFSDGLACVRKGLKKGYIDKEGHVAILLQFENARSFSEGLAGVRMSLE